MRFALSLLLSAGLFTLSIASASAQQAPPWQAPPQAYAPPAYAPAPVATATAAPAVDPDISQINGIPVPVGQHNDYYYSFKRWNVSTNPLGWVMGLYGGSVSYGVHKNFALRADLNYFRPVDTETEGFEVGIGAPLYFRRTYQGLFLEPGVILRSFNDHSYDEGSTTYGPQMLVGWHWMWDSGLNFAIAGGVGRNWSTHDSDENHYDDSELFANGYMRFGYAF